MPFDLVVFDLDGTVLRRDLTISEATVEALRRLRERGMRLVVATGRRFEAAREYARWLGSGGSEPLICYGGAMVRRLDGETLMHRTLEREVSLEVLEWAEGRGLHARVFLDGEVVEHSNPPEAFSHLPREPDISFVESPLRWLRHHGEEPTKITLVDHPERVEGWLEEARERFAGRLFVTRSMPHYVEVGDLKSTKSRALELLCARWGIDPERVLAFGDAENDADMLRLAGRGVAVGGMSREVREAADEVVPPVEEDGVAGYVEKLLGER